MNERKIFPSTQYTLYYTTRSPLSPEEIGQEQRVDDIVTALSQAFLRSRKGDNPTHLVFDDAVLFSGEELNEVLKLIEDNGGYADLAEAVRKTLPEVLIKQLVKTVKFSHEHFGAVAVYRSMLEELYEAADQAIQKNDLALLHKITGKLAFWYVPAEGDVKQWGKEFLHAYRRDAGWLQDTQRALEKIKKAVEKLEVADGSPNADLKAQVMKAAEDGLITHI
jgi:hypothetical protein